MGTTVRVLIMQKLKEITNNLFGEMRDMTPEESEAHSRYISSISTPTGINIWDLVDDIEDDIDFIQPKKKIPVNLHIVNIKKHQIK